jgi:hypothetical protein
MQLNPVIPPELTPEIVYLRGEYSLSKYTIPYFSSVVPFSFAIDKFSLVEDIPEVARVEWSLLELFQRDIAWERIHDELIKYLRNENRPQFFNALTIALLPRSGHGFGGVYESPHKYAPMADLGLGDVIQIGGIQIQGYKGTQGLAGKLRWDPKQITAVAVDGQHRLAAVKTLRGTMLPEKLEASYLPVIFLIPDSRVGFVEPPQPTGAVQAISTLRQVFIDLNKNARPVSRVRNILLDDVDIVSVCVRLLMGERLSDKPEKDRIPLAFVDWMSERKNKIEEGPFVTTVLLLRDIVEEAIRPPDMEEFEEEDKGIRRWLQDRFEPSAEQLSDLMSQVQRCFHLEVPLSFTPEQLDLLAERFKTLWRPYIHRVFSEIRPYKELWVYGNAKGFHKPEIVNLYAAKYIFEGAEAERRAERIVNEVRIENPIWSFDKDFAAPLKHMETVIKDELWAFKVVFQKALFSSFVGLMRQAEAFVEGGGGVTDVRGEFAGKWIEAVNRLFESPLAMVTAPFSETREPFWAGIGLRSDETIDFTKAGVKRIASWLNVWTCLYWLQPDAPTYSQLSKDARPLAEYAYNALTLRTTTEGMLRLARAQGEHSEEEEKAQALELLKRRQQYMRKLIAGA